MDLDMAMDGVSVQGAAAEAVVCRSGRPSGAHELCMPRLAQVVRVCPERNSTCAGRSCVQTCPGRPSWSHCRLPAAPCLHVKAGAMWADRCRIISRVQTCPD